MRMTILLGSCGLALTLAGCGGDSASNSTTTTTSTTQTTADTATAPAPNNSPAGLAGPDDATVHAGIEKAWTDVGSSDTQSFEYQSIERSDPRTATMTESVDANIPQDTMVYPVKVTMIRHFDSANWSIVRAALFWKTDNGWASSVIASADTKTERMP